MVMGTYEYVPLGLMPLVSLCQVSQAHAVPGRSLRLPSSSVAVVGNTIRTCRLFLVLTLLQYDFAVRVSST